MMDVTRFWYKRGVAGFRLDAVDTLFEDPQLTDNPSKPGTDKFGRPNFETKIQHQIAGSSRRASGPSQSRG